MYDDVTEVLTKNGWKLVGVLTTDDQLVVLGGHDSISYRKPDNVRHKTLSGRLIEIKAVQAVNLRVTPDHNIYAAPIRYWDCRVYPFVPIDRPFRLHTAEECVGKRLRFKKGGAWEGEEQKLFQLPSYSFKTAAQYGKYQIRIRPERTIKMDDWLNFLGWFCSEGYSISEGRIIRIAYNYNSSEEAILVQSAIEKSGFRCDRKEQYFAVTGVGMQLGTWLSDHCGSRSIKKKVPSFIFGLSSRQIGIFLNSLFLGDASKAKSHKLPDAVFARLQRVKARLSEVT